MVRTHSADGRYTQPVLLPEMGVMRPEDDWWSWSERLPVRARAVLRFRFVRFLLIGGLNTVFGYSAFASLILLGVPYALAVLLATVAGILFNFRTYGTFVFGSRDLRLLLRFFFVYAVCYVLNLIPLAWAEKRGISLLLAGAVVAVPMAFIAYTLNRLFVFSRGEQRR